MKLPNADRAIVAGEKLLGYLLRPDQLGGKGGFFASLGYTESNWQELEAALKDHALTGDVLDVEPTDWGPIYVVVGAMVGPSRSSNVRSVWIVRTDEDVPRLITAYPQK